jgi:hypothetical protein
MNGKIAPHLYHGKRSQGNDLMHLISHMEQLAAEREERARKDDMKRDEIHREQEDNGDFLRFSVKIKNNSAKCCISGKWRCNRCNRCSRIIRTK